MTTLLAGAFVNNVLFNVLRGKGPEDKDKLPAWLAARMTFGMADGIPIARDVAGYAEGKILGEHGKDFQALSGAPGSEKTRWTLDSQPFMRSKGRPLSEQGHEAGRASGRRTDWTAGDAREYHRQYIYDVLSGNYKPQHPWSPITDAFYARPTAFPCRRVRGYCLSRGKDETCPPT
jgi:hypothetical protein